MSSKFATHQGVEHSTQEYKVNKKVNKLIVKTIPLPLPPFSQRLKKKKEEGKFKMFISMLKELSSNIPLLEAFEKIPGYEKFMKDFVTKKRTINYEDKSGLHHCSAVTLQSLAQKKGDPGGFTIPCIIRKSRFFIALCDLGSSIILIPLAMFKQLGLRPPELIIMRLLMVDHTMKKPIVISFDMMVKVDNFIFPTKFVVLDYKVDFDMPIIFRRPFLSTARALVDIEKEELKFRLNDEEFTFNICRTMN
ncbi:uncharacterized protein LOC124888886 [Capsicum annuum]|uniref:uncharacterized protein LOC124888886 n=1 Tax=Capsicum annuum TaxID=4072 RepID=UPI001FB188B8|nr:uncharacterized protein LOC124888886 [Capsicum annuum]